MLLDSPLSKSHPGSGDAASLAPKQSKVSVKIGPFSYHIEAEVSTWLSPLMGKLEQSSINTPTRLLKIIGDENVSLPPEPAGWIYDVNSIFGKNKQIFVGPEFKLEFNLEDHLATCWVDPNLEERFYIRPIENALRILVAYDVIARGGVLLHSAGIALDGFAHVFVGQSGAGKSTLCKTSLSDASCLILSDELNILLPIDDKLFSYSMPFAGDFGGKGSKPYPVKRLAAIRQAKVSSMTKANPPRMLARCCANAPFANGNPFVLDRVLSNIAQALNHTDSVSMDLILGDTPWSW